MQNIARTLQLKQRLIDFVYDAEGKIAIALESYAAQKGKKNSYGIKQQNLTIDLFVTQETIEGQSIIEIFCSSTTDLEDEDLELIKLWTRNFIGLFEIKEIAEDYYCLMNWLTAKTYKVYRHQQMTDKEVNRWQPGEIILTILAPLDQSEWTFFSDRIIKGKLSQPKLAVAVGEFRDNYPEFLYADAPEQLEEAWSSVAVYHQEFVDFMQGDCITLPGYKLNQKITELQQLMSNKRLAAAGIDDSKSISDMLAESGTTEAEFTEAASDMGADAAVVSDLIKNKDRLSMVTPKVDLPPEIKQAETVTVFSDPRWGQMFLANFTKFTDLLEQDVTEINSESTPFVRKYLEQPEANYYVWQQLKREYPETIAKLLQIYCLQSDFNLDTDLDKLLLEYNKPATPQLPSIASVPLHLNDLFEAALTQVQKTKSKAKKAKKKKGFS